MASELFFLTEPSPAAPSVFPSLAKRLEVLEVASLAETPLEPLKRHHRRGRLTSICATSKMGDDVDHSVSTPSTLSDTTTLYGYTMHKPAEEDRPQTPQTPRATYNNPIPSETAIAQHVQSIQVPDAVAASFRLQSSSPITPGDNNNNTNNSNRPSSSGNPNITATQRRRGPLTLKEQNAIIDTLHNENFHLKLKIHFLDDALQKRSEDGVKELIERNVQLQTDLVKERKTTHHMKSKIENLERKVREQAEALVEAQQTTTDDDDDPTLQAQMHEEILYLRQRLDSTEDTVITLRESLKTTQQENSKMADRMRSMAGSRGQDTAGMQETVDIWQDLVNAEIGRREQAEEDISKLRDELNNLRLERASTNNSNKRTSRAEKRRSRRGATRSPSGSQDEFMLAAEEVETQTKRLTDELNNLKHENSELRRDLGAQTSMLTSRNRERERLQQEIEDLKLLQRKGDGARSVAGDSIFDRSISRAHQRSHSRASDHTQITEAERDEWDKKEGQLRDTNAELRLKYQELDRTHKNYLHFVSVLEGDYTQMENDLNECREDLLNLQSERDEALNAYEETEGKCKKLEEEATAEIQTLEDEKKTLSEEIDSVHARLQKTQQKLQTTTDDYKGLTGELRQLTQRVIDLEDVKQHNMRTIQTLEQQITEVEDEIQKWESKCSELDQKNRKLEITEESLHNEVTFLREEQETDKIKIGELEDAINAAHQTIQDEHEKLRELEVSIVEERQQRDVLENKSKDEVQKVLDDLNIENARIKDEVRKLRRALSAKEIEASSTKQKLDEFEKELRQILGHETGSRPGMLNAIERLQRELETTTNDLERAKMDLSDKDRLLRHRDGLLESTSLESRRLSDLLDKERASRKHDLEQFDKASRGQATHMRTIAQQESRVLELETAYTQTQRKSAALEQQFREHLHERNSLLLALWNRLSTLCGSDWAQGHALIDGEVPSVEVIGKHLPSFNKNIISAVKTVEALFGSFKSRIRTIEKDLWRDYQTLTHNIEIKNKTIERIEAVMDELQRRIAEDARRSSVSSKPSSPARGLVKLLRHQSTSAVEQFSTREGASRASIQLPPSPLEPSDARWNHRLREMERRLKAEREARLLDRKGARQRLNASEGEKEELRRQLEKKDENLAPQ